MQGRSMYVLGMEGGLPVPLDRDGDSRIVPRLKAAKTWAWSGVPMI